MKIGISFWGRIPNISLNLEKSLLSLIISMLCLRESQDFIESFQNLDNKSGNGIWDWAHERDKKYLIPPYQAKYKSGIFV